MPPLRILLVNANYADGTVGGTQSFTASLAGWLRDAGHTVGVMCQGHDDFSEVLDDILVYRVCPPRFPVSNDLKIAYWINQTLSIQNPLISHKVSRVFEKFNPDICHIQMLRQLTPTVIDVARRKSIPIVQTVHEWFSLWNFNAYQRKDSPQKIYSSPPPIVRALKSHHRSLSRGVSHVCAPSLTAVEPYIQDGYFSGVPLTIIPNSTQFSDTDPGRLADERALRRRAARPIEFLFLGRLDYYKGVGTLLQAMKILKDDPMVLHIAGEGVMEAEVVAATVDSRIVFHGAVSGAVKESLIARSDVMVCPSTWTETFGLSVLEGFAAGMPVIGSRVGALPDLIRDEQEGLLVDPGSVDQLAKSMRRMLEPDLRAAMSIRAATRAMLYTPEVFLRKQMAVYERALN